MARLRFFTCLECGEGEWVAGSNAGFVCYSCSPPEERDPLGKQRAHAAVANAIRTGKLPHPTECLCADCGGPAIEFDHRDYNEPLSVAPVCRGCNLRRGPAVPIAGALSKIVAAGRAPYSLKVRVAQLVERFGVSRSVLDDMPKMLRVEHWRQILQHLPEGA
jgi:hypothetical protein